MEKPLWDKDCFWKVALNLIEIGMRHCYQYNCVQIEFALFISCIQVISATVISEFPIFISTSTYEDRNETGALDELQTTFL